MLFVNSTHKCSSWRKNIIHKDENGLFRRQLDSFANHIDKLTYREIRRNEILFLVNRRDIRFVYLFANYWDSLSVFVADSICLSFAGLKRVLVLELGFHDSASGGDSSVCVCVVLVAITSKLAVVLWLSIINSLSVDG